MEETLVLANRLEELGRLAAWLHGLAATWGLEEHTGQALDLALEEVVVNVMNHAYGPGVDLPITVRLTREPHRVAARVEDLGPSFDPLAAPGPPQEVPLLERAPGGLGVFLARRLMDEMTWQRADGKNILTMIKRLGRPGPEGV